MRISLSTLWYKRMMPNTIEQNRIFKPKNIINPKGIIKPKTVVVTFFMSLLGFGSISSQAQIADLPIDDMVANPVANIELIDLTNADDSFNNDTSGQEDADYNNDDSIDDRADESALIDEVEDEDSDIPDDVAQVSLNAISPETLKTFVAVVDLVRREYVDAVNDEELFNNAMSGMLTKLDSYAEFLDAEAYENLRAFTQGDVGDVGMQADYQSQLGYWVISDVIPNSPADNKGIAAGDYLHQINEFTLDADNLLNDIEQRLTGIAGTQVNVVVSKAGRRKRTVSLQRNNTHPQMIETRLIDGVAVIGLPLFQDNSREKILESLIDLEAPISAIVLDVRDNPGGVLTAAVKVASLFMTNTDVVQVKGRQGDARTLETTGTAPLQSIPLVILQNRYSASAAEVLASSLQAQKRAIVVGEVSYGKGSVQSVIPLNDQQAVKLTVAHYLTAKGKKIDELGVKPDINLLGSESSWEQQALDKIQPLKLASGVRLIHKQ